MKLILSSKVTGKRLDCDLVPYTDGIVIDLNEHYELRIIPEEKNRLTFAMWSKRDNSAICSALELNVREMAEMISQIAKGRR